MWTYSTISLVVMLGMFAAGVIGFLAGWLARRAIMEERKDDEESVERYGQR